ncbi:MAG: cytochrome-c peroxidase [Calditrichaceae bacterium]|nr:cytochrome-c peroxidase [Calditrichia bacterium]NUQ42590.1 cytochrome-c peroxidase [Calditrichaceae bacterium]
MRLFLLLTSVLFVLAAFSNCAKKETSVKIDQAMLAAFKPLPEIMESANNPVTLEKVELGRMLFYEKRLSKSHEFSCNSCHDLNTFGVDNQPVSDGHKQQTGTRNSPSVYNAAGQVAQFWDGRAGDVEEQAKGPILNPVEMAMPDEKLVVKTLKSIPGYVEAFQKAFPGEKDPITYDNMAKAIGAFERKLVTPSRWDKFLRGDETALTNEEKTGFNKFVENGCVTCHSGPYLGGGMFQKLGMVQPWPGNEDAGRFHLTNNEADKFVFKVASLRNVAQTAPYLHSGAINNLEEMVAMMARHQMNKTPSPEDIRYIVSFLNSMTGEIPTEYIKEPALPPSGPNTPKPDAE